MSFALSALVSESDVVLVVQPLSPPASTPPLASESDRTFSAAPTVMTFFAEPGELTVPVPGPSLPAENTITIGLPGFNPVTLRTRISKCCASKS